MHDILYNHLYPPSCSSNIKNKSIQSNCQTDHTCWIPLLPQASAAPCRTHIRASSQLITSQRKPTTTPSVIRRNSRSRVPYTHFLLVLDCQSPANYDHDSYTKLVQKRVNANGRTDTTDRITFPTNDVGNQSNKCQSFESYTVHYLRRACYMIRARLVGSISPIQLSAAEFY